MNANLIGTLVAKDLSLFFRNRFFAFVTVFGLIVYVALYFLMPNSVDETVEIALYAPTIPDVLAEIFAEEGVVLENFATEADLRQAILDGDYQAGIALPTEAVERVIAGEKGQVQLYLASDLPEDFYDTYEILMEELGFLIGGQPLNFEASEEILGPDMVGAQIAPRNRMLPILAVFVLMIEMLGLASLISAEVAAGTLQALFITPVTVSTLFVSKAITGVGMAFVQAFLLMAITGGLSSNPLLLIIALLIGSLFITGVAFLMATVGYDMMSVMAAGFPILIILAIPAFNILVPGTASNWIKAIPSYYLVDTVHRIVNFGAGWGDVANNLLILLALAVLFLGLGVLALRRKFR